MVRHVKAAAAWLPLILLLAAAAIEALRLPLLLALALGFAATLWRARITRTPPGSAAFVYGACMLVAMSAVWSGVALPVEARDGSSCTDLLAPFAVYRASGAVLVLVAVGLVVRLLGSTAGDIGIRRASLAGLALAVGALLSVGIVATFIGPAVPPVPAHEVVAELLPGPAPGASDPCRGVADDVREIPPRGGQGQVLLPVRVRNDRCGD